HWRRPSLGLPRTQPNEVTVVDITKNHQVVGTIPVGDGPRPPIMTADGKRIYMDVDRLMGFLVIDTEARKVIAKATMNLTADEQASVPNGHAHGIAIGNGGKEVWTNATGQTDPHSAGLGRETLGPRSVRRRSRSTSRNRYTRPTGSHQRRALPKRVLERCFRLDRTLRDLSARAVCDCTRHGSGASGQD